MKRICFLLSFVANRLAIVTFLTFEFQTETRFSAIFGQHPFARNERRFVADVLNMSALQLSSPIFRVVAVVTDNFPFHNFIFIFCAKPIFIQFSLKSVRQSVEEINYFLIKLESFFRAIVYRQSAIKVPATHAFGGKLLKQAEKQFK
jgi:hypothetical protein